MVSELAVVLRVRRRFHHGGPPVMNKLAPLAAMVFENLETPDIWGAPMESRIRWIPWNS
jgi:hypothetical protein